MISCISLSTYLIIYKNWGRIDVINKKKEVILGHNWHKYAPKQPSQELLELMRSYEITNMIILDHHHHSK